MLSSFKVKKLNLSRNLLFDFSKITSIVSRKSFSWRTIGFFRHQDILVAMVIKVMGLNVINLSALTFPLQKDSTLLCNKDPV